MSRNHFKDSTFQLKLESIIDSNSIIRFANAGENSAKTVIRDVKSLIEIDKDIRDALNPENITELNKLKKTEEIKEVTREDLIQLANDLDDYLIEMMNEKNVEDNNGINNEDKKLVNDYDNEIIDVYIIVIVIIY